MTLILRDVPACEKSLGILTATENEHKAREKDWDEAKKLKNKLADVEVDAKMAELDDLRAKMSETHQKQLTNLNIGNENFMKKIMCFRKCLKNHI